MAWEKQIMGYKIQAFLRTSIIPPDAVFLNAETVHRGRAGWISAPVLLQETVFNYQIPIYKKVRTKKPR